MNHEKLYKTIVSALLTAIICVATLAIRIPSPLGGYNNLGDCFILLAAWLMGPVYGGLAAGLGSALADLLSGYAYYVPGSFFVKGGMAVIFALLVRCSGSKKKRAYHWISGAIAELWMVAGYLGYASVFLGKGSAAFLKVPGNLIQGAVGLIAGSLLMELLLHSGILHTELFHLDNDKKE